MTITTMARCLFSLMFEHAHSVARQNYKECYCLPVFVYLASSQHTVWRHCSSQLFGIDSSHTYFDFTYDKFSAEFHSFW